MACKYKSRVWDNGWCNVACRYCTLTQEATCKHNKQTNADKIRAMTDEELADFFFESPEIEFVVCEYCRNFGGHTSDFPCLTEHGLCDVSDKNEAFKKWLKQPAEDDC